MSAIPAVPTDRQLLSDEHCGRACDTWCMGCSLNHLTKKLDVYCVWKSRRCRSYLQWKNTFCQRCVSTFKRLPSVGRY